MKYILVACFFLTSCSLETSGKIVQFSGNDFNYNNVNLSDLIVADVVYCIDGDTIRVKILSSGTALSEYETVRMIGVDTPETKDPRYPVQFYGEEAAEYTDKILYGRMIYLAFDSTLRDKYGRLLCYIIFEDRTMHNYNLVYNGYGYAYTIYTFAFIDQFIAAEKDAKTNRRGLWYYY